jgi:hypothetical protein
VGQRYELAPIKSCDTHSILPPIGWWTAVQGMKTLRPTHQYCVQTCILAGWIWIPRPVQLNHMIITESSHQQGGELQAGFKSTETHLQELHCGVYLLPCRCNRSQPRFSKSCDFHSLLPSTWKWTVKQGLKALRLTSRNIFQHVTVAWPVRESWVQTLWIKSPPQPLPPYRELNCWMEVISIKTIK